MSHNIINVAILSDYLAFRQGIKMMFNAEEGLQMMYDLPCSLTSAFPISGQKPDILLYDVHSCPHKMLESFRIVKAASVFSKIIVLFSASSQQIFRGVKIYAYHSMDCGIGMLKSLIFRVAAGTRQYTPQDQDASHNKMATCNALTRRELEVVKYLTLGKTSREIGNILGIALKTVDVHRHNILSKLGLSKTSALVNQMTDKNLI